MAGGGPGERGLNLVRFARDGRTINLGGKNTITVGPGDRLLIHSPGGGGYGAADGTREQAGDAGAGEKKEGARSSAVMTSGSLHQYSLNQESV
jgi:5-oxoprolinase (ATP-hydrolysing)